MLNLAGSVVFPSGSGIRGWVLSMLEWIYGGVGNYAATIILFTILIRVMFIPLDFGTKYFTKKNNIRMQKLKPEEEAIKAQYADNPVAMYRARQELYKKHGYGIGGFCLFTLANLVIMLIVFINVFQALNAVASPNIRNQYTQLQVVYEYHSTNSTLDSDQFRQDINQVYNETRVSFLWVHNMWQPDTMWAQRSPSFETMRDLGVFGNPPTRPSGMTDEDWNTKISDWHTANRSQFDTIFNNIDGAQGRMNGWFLLVIMAAIATFLSVWINSKTMHKKSEPDKPKEEQVGYSMRAAKSDVLTTNKPTSFDPAQMQKMMKFVLPIIMVIFTLTTTAALALYITVSSLVATGIAFGLKYLVDLLIKRGDTKRKQQDSEETDMTIINPHAKFFKSKK